MMRMRNLEPGIGRRQSSWWFVLLGLAAALGLGATGPRRVTSLDLDWRFHRGEMPDALVEISTNGEVRPSAEFLGPTYDDSSWVVVNLPHDYVVEGSFDPKAETQHGSLPVEPAWYRKAITVPAEDHGRRLWLEFDGVYRDSRMWFNGHFLGRHASGYTSFRYDISELARPGEDNQLVVRVDPREFEGWWYEGGGIYRHVRLVSLDPVHVVPWGLQVITDVKHPGKGARADAQLEVATALANETSSAVDATVLSEVLDAAGALRASARTLQSIAPGDSPTCRQSLALAKADLWSCERPYLYHLRTRILVAGATVDEIDTMFGVRTIRFDPDRGFFLNGKPLKIKGVCNHQDFAGIGVALPDALQLARVQKLKEMGANAWRCAHNQVAEELLDACDRLGLLVLAENRHLDDSPEILGEMESLVRRDRNHPSIILWCLSNEEKEQGSETGARQGRALAEVIHRWDRTRPITAAMNNGIGHGLTGVIDVQGFNYHPETYDRLHRDFPKKPFLATEMAAAVGTRGVYERQSFTVPKDTAHYLGDPARREVAAYDVNAPDWAETAEVAWKAIADRPWMAGGFVWCGFDYRGEPTPFLWPAIGSQYGILDTCGFPKDAYYYYQSWWSDRPVLHLFPHWNWPGREREEIPVWVYSNCEKVELFLNGTSLGAQRMKPNSHLEWKVKYVPGKLVAKGICQGMLVQTSVETTGLPAGIMLAPDRTALHANDADISLVSASIVDAHGRTVPVATNMLTFRVSGPARLLGLGNGDPNSHEPDKAIQRSAFNGLCLAIFQAAGTPGTITIRATSPGLAAGTATIEAR